MGKIKMQNEQNWYDKKYKNINKFRNILFNIVSSIYGGNRRKRLNGTKCQWCGKEMFNGGIYCSNICSDKAYENFLNNPNKLEYDYD
jgi:uncharacterized OB-fold protein